MKTIIVCLLAVLFGLTSCEKVNNDTPPFLENEKDVTTDLIKAVEENGVMEKFAIDAFIQSLQGTWRTDSYILYDKEYKEVVQVIIENNRVFGEGFSATFYIFNECGTLTTYADGCNPSTPIICNYFCSYNQESKILTLTNRATIDQYLVSSYDGESLVLDYTIHQYDSYIDKHYYRYVRETLKRDPDWTMPQN